MNLIEAYNIIERSVKLIGKTFLHLKFNSVTPISMFLNIVILFFLGKRRLSWMWLVTVQHLYVRQGVLLKVSYSFWPQLYITLLISPEQG